MRLPSQIGVWVGECCGCTAMTSVSDSHLKSLGWGYDDLLSHVEDGVKIATASNYVIVLAVTKKCFSNMEKALEEVGFEKFVVYDGQTMWYYNTCKEVDKCVD